MKQADEDLAKLRAYIERASFSHQERLPPERDLAAQLGVTRSRLRTSLRKLAGEGAIWRHVGKGTFFGPRLRPAGVAFPVDGAHDITNPREVMTARLAIEPAIARLAAIHATGRDLQTMRALLDEMARLHEWSAWEPLDWRLHRAIAVAAGNRLMLMVYDTVQAHRSVEIWGSLREIVDAHTGIERATREHRAMVEAIGARDPDAAERAMREHLQHVEASIFRGA